MKLLLSSYETSKKLVKRIYLEIDIINVIVKYNQHKQEFPIEEFNNIMEDYEPNSLISGSLPSKRLLFDRFPIQYNDSVMSGLFRLVPLIYNAYGLNVVWNFIKNGQYINSKIQLNYDQYYIKQREFAKKHFNDEGMTDLLLIEKTGAIGPQPTAYVLPTKPFSINDLFSIYKKGYLIKLMVKIEGLPLLKTFIFPLHLRYVTKQDRILLGSTWKKILDLREKKMEELIR